MLVGDREGAGLVLVGARGGTVLVLVGARGWGSSGVGGS